MTREQHRAREMIALYEGAGRVTCEFEGHDLIVETDTGWLYTVSRDGRIIREDGWRTDWQDLESRANRPDLYRHDPEWDDPPLDGIVAKLEQIGERTDFDEDRQAELQAEAKRIQDDVNYYRRLEGWRHA